MNLRAVDLNLLVILDALLDEVHVSRAAERLGLSQPATSSALNRCRHLFNDPLLERVAGGLRLTAKGESLKSPLRDILTGTVTLLDPSPVRLEDLRQTVRIVTGDQMAAMIADTLLERLALSAPGLDLVLQPYNGIQGALDSLAKGATDLAVTVFRRAGPEFRLAEWMQATWSVVMRRDHPAAASFDLQAWLDFPHILVSGRGDTRSDLDHRLAEMGRQRRVGLVVPSFMMVPAILKKSDFIAMMPSRLLPPDLVQDLAVFDPPIVMAPFPVHIAWHGSRDTDLAVQHVKETLLAIDPPHS